ncbi:MAG: hypothetical protein J5730_02835, partial [Bacteroidales bacterium]|nr:hypothetical protein [Bacteroidales bacterium]
TSINNPTSDVTRFQLENLEPNTHYFARIFATNSAGTFYSDDVDFTTTIVMGEPCPEAATVTDYDGNEYATVQIGSQCWMKEDLRTTHYANGTEILGFTSLDNMLEGYPYYYNENQVFAFQPNTPTNYAPNNNVPGSTYGQQDATGYFYFGDAIVNGSREHNDQHLQGVCPQGWHVPTLAEWHEMFDLLGENYRDMILASGSNTSGFNGNEQYARLMNGNLTIEQTPFPYSSSELFNMNGIDYLVTWNGSGNSFTQFANLVRCIKGDGITTLPVSHVVAANDIISTEASLWGETRTDGGASLTSYGVCWSSSNQEPTTADSTHSFASDYVGRYYFRAQNLTPNTTYYFRSFATNANGTVYSDSVISFTTPIMMNQPCPETPTVTDYDGNVYNTVQIGNQCWMKEDLRTTHYANGAEILRFNSYQSFMEMEGYPFYYSENESYVIPNDLPNNYIPGNTNGLSSTTGLFYFGYAVVNGSYTHGADAVQGVCPQGWHVSTPTEWHELFNLLGENYRDMIFTSGSNVTGFNGNEKFAYINDNNSLMVYQTAKPYISSRVFSQNSHHYLMSWDYSGCDFMRFAHLVRCVKGDGTTTLPQPKTVAVNEVMSTSAALWGETCTDGGATLTRRGLCYSSTHTTPTVSDNVAYRDDDFVGRYRIEVNDLEPNTTYYFRAYAINANGTAYADSVMSFTTTAQMGQSCPDADSVVDYDGNVYATILIGEQCWMRSNLRTTHYPNGNLIYPHSAANYYPRYFVLREIDDGYLYPLYTVCNGFANVQAPLQGICPEGWHVPSSDEYLTMFNTLGGFEAALPLLKASYRWETPGNNASGFNLLPAGEYSYGYFANDNTLLQTSTRAHKFLVQDDRIREFGEGGRDEFGSVRCIKGAGQPIAPTAKVVFVDSVASTTANVQGELLFDGGATVTQWGVAIGTEPFPTDEYIYTNDNSISVRTFMLENLQPSTHYYVRIFSTNTAGTYFSEQVDFTTQDIPTGPVTGPCPEAQYVTDMDGNIYNTVKIGSQCWMKENLRTTLFGDGTAIDPENGNNSARYMEPTNRNGYTVNLYGRFYNYDAATKMAPHNHNEAVQGVCPSGWHLPSRSEWETLYATAASMGTNAAAALTENSAFWTDGLEHTNTSGFSARPGSYSFASYDSTGNGAYGKAFYFATADFNSESMVAEMSYAATCINGQLDFTPMATNIYMPVRCIKGDGVSAFAPSLEINYRGVTTSEASLVGEYYDNGHIINDFELYMGTDPNQMIQVTYGTPYYGGGQWSFFWLNNLTPGTTYYIQMCMLYDDTQRVCVNGSFTTEYDGLEPCPESPTMYDVEGNVYNTILINNKCWMRENLRTTHYANGDAIPSDDRMWGSDSVAYYYSPGNDRSNVPTYGRLYNWSAVMKGAGSSSSNPSTVQGVCPAGWHVPSYPEMKQMIEWMGNNGYACSGGTARAMASESTWNSSNAQCHPGYVGNDSPQTANSSGFSAVAAGSWKTVTTTYTAYTAYGMGIATTFWTSTLAYGNYARSFTINYNANDIAFDGMNLKENAYSVRCVKN